VIGRDLLLQQGMLEDIGRDLILLENQHLFFVLEPLGDKKTKSS